MDKNKENSLDFIKKSFELKNSKLYKEAIEMLYKALEAEGGSANVEIISQIADLYAYLKNYDRALEEYEKVLEADKNHTHSLNEMLKIYFSLEKYEKALEVSKRLLETTSDAQYYINHLEILYKLNRLDKMRELYETFDDKLKNNAQILYIMSKTELYPKIEFLNKAVSTDNTYAPAYFE